MQWTRRFLAFEKGRLADATPDTEVVAFLTQLATQAHVTASTQNQALSALMFLYAHVLKRDPGKLEGRVMAEPSKRKPTSLTTGEVTSILGCLNGIPYLIASLIYGTGMRIREVMRLRIQDVDLGQHQISVRDDNNQMVRLKPLPLKAANALLTQMAIAKDRQTEDLKNGHAPIFPPTVAEPERSGMKKSLGWQFLFPSRSLYVDPRTGLEQRCHMSQAGLLSAFRRAASQAGIAKSVGPEILRDSFATHMLALGSDVRTVKEIMGHSSLKTTQFYNHAPQAIDCPVIQSDFLPTPKLCSRLAWFNRMLRSGISLAEIEARRWSRDEGDYSIYCLAEDSQRVRYIGITNQAPESRLRQHLADCGRGRNLHKENWLRSCVQRGIPITIHVVRSGLTAERASMMEFELIRFFKKAFSLVNTHAGGSTGYAGLSEESKQKHRINTEKGLTLSFQKELEAQDMERGYCLLEEWGWSDENPQPGGAGAPSIDDSQSSDAP